jgi:iron complex outermembrane receptor protein
VDSYLIAINTPKDLRGRLSGQKLLLAFSMKKYTALQAACLLACGASLSVAQAQQAPQDIPEIIITASRSEQDLQTAPVGATIITRAQIESAGVVDANEAIRKIGGVAAHADLYGGREYTLDLRGFGTTSNENTVVLVDGIRISENEMGLPPRLTGIAASSIERIEILSGGAGVMWGDGATAGVINIITRKDVKAGVSGQVGVGVESYGGKEATANLRVGANAGNGVIDLNARSYFANGYRSNNKSSQDVFSLGYAYSDGALSFRSRLNREVSNVGLPGSLGLPDFLANPRKTTTPLDWYAYAMTKLSAGLDYRLGHWAFVIDWGIKNRSTGFQYVSQSAPVTNAEVNTAQLSPRAVFKGNLGVAALTANLGMDVNVWSYSNSRAFDVSWTPTARTGQQSNRAVFAMTDWLLPSQTRFVAGYRLENVAKSSQDAISAPLVTSNLNQMHAGELSVNQTIQKEVDVYARLATSYRIANIDEYNSWVNSAQPLPQTSRDKEMGLKWRSTSTSATVRYFVQNTINEISNDPSGALNWNSPSPTKRSGIALQGTSTLSPSVTLSGGMQLMQAKYDGGLYAGNQIPSVSNQTAVIRAAYRVDANQSVETAIRILSPQYFSGDFANNCGSQVPASRMVDVLYRYKTGAYDLSFGANNLTNVLSYSAIASSCATAFQFVSYYPEAGRTFRATVKYNF